MNEINQLVSPETQASILQVIALLTVAMPLLEKAAHATKNKVDDKILDVVKQILAYVPRVGFGKGPVK